MLDQLEQKNGYWFFKNNDKYQKKFKKSALISFNNKKSWRFLFRNFEKGTFKHDAKKCLHPKSNNP